MLGIGAIDSCHHHLPLQPTTPHTLAHASEASVDELAVSQRLRFPLGLPTPRAKSILTHLVLPAEQYGLDSPAREETAFGLRVPLRDHAHSAEAGGVESTRGGFSSAVVTRDSVKPGCVSFRDDGHSA